MRTRHTFTLLAILLVGCSSVNDSSWLPLPGFQRKEEAVPPVKRPAGIPKLAVAGQNLGEGQEVSLTTGQFLQSVQELLDAQRRVSASRWVARHPEVTLEVLRNMGEMTPPAATLQFLADVHDRQTWLSAAQPGWTDLLALRSRATPEWQAFATARQQFNQLLSEGNPAAAQRLELLNLARATNHPLVMIEALRLQGTAQLLAEDPAAAATSWQEAIALAEPRSAYLATHLSLLVSDALRRSGDHVGAVNTWLAATRRAIALLEPARPCLDPVLWERIAYLRPVSAAWPEEVVARWQAIDPLPEPVHLSAAERAEACLWNCTGRWYLDRGQHQAALVAFKRAEAATAHVATQQFLRFRQARALVLLEQAGPATAVLLPMAQDPQSSLSRPALALLGSLRLQAGQPQQGLNLLRRALEPDEHFTWLERPQAEADYALALLMLGEESRGLAQLHHARTQFQAQGEFEALALTMLNEARYLDQLQRSREAQALRSQLTELERVIDDEAHSRT
jgi:tetratricopeptide (TPR) repeat protein